MTQETLQDLANTLAGYWRDYIFWYEMEDGIWCKREDGKQIAMWKQERAEGFRTALKTIGIEIFYTPKTVTLVIDNLKATAIFM